MATAQTLGATDVTPTGAMAQTGGKTEPPRPPVLAAGRAEAARTQALVPVAPPGDANDGNEFPEPVMRLPAGMDVTTQLSSGGGQLGGYLSARDGDIPTALGALDQLAYGISTAVNAQNNAGMDLNGELGTAANPLYLFNDPAQVPGSAAAMRVVMSDPSQIAAAGAGNGTGDNSNAAAMANLAKQVIVNGQTPINSYSNFVSTLGATVAKAQLENTAQNASVTQLQAQNNALSKVNLNDEAAAMSMLETSYQAASQVFSILNSIMTSALNLGVETAVS